MGEEVFLREVGLRDGLQMVKTNLATPYKLEWIADAVATGVTRLEVTSFVPPKTFPIFADAAEIAAAALTYPGVEVSALAVNLRGAQAAFAGGLRHVSYVLSASEGHSLANARRSTDEAVQEFARIVAARDESGLRESVALSCGIATAFGCSIQGYVDPERVLDLAAQVTALGAAEVMLADTVGYADPAQVEHLFAQLRERQPDLSVAAHFHDTRGLGLANAAAALRVGVRRFDASIGGLGGCPFAPGATGNVNFEDMVFMLGAMGFKTGVALEPLLALRAKAVSWLPEERFSGASHRALMPPGLAAHHAKTKIGGTS